MDDYGMSCIFKEKFEQSVLYMFHNAFSMWILVVISQEISLNPDFGFLVFKKAVKSKRGSEIGYAPAKWIMQKVICTYLITKCIMHPFISHNTVSWQGEAAAQSIQVLPKPCWEMHLYILQQNKYKTSSGLCVVWM